MTGWITGLETEKWEACLIMVGVYLCCCGNGIVVYTLQNSPLLWSGSWVGLAGETRNYCSGQVRMVSSEIISFYSWGQRKVLTRVQSTQTLLVPLWLGFVGLVRPGNMTRRKTGCVSLVNKTLEKMFSLSKPAFFWHISAWIWNLLFSAQISFQGLVKHGVVILGNAMNQKYPQNFKCYHRSVFKSQRIIYLRLALSVCSPRFKLIFCWNCFCRNSDYLSRFLVFISFIISIYVNHFQTETSV